MPGKHKNDTLKVIANTNGVYMDDKLVDNNPTSEPELKDPTTETSLSAVDLSKDSTSESSDGPTLHEMPPAAPFKLPIRPQERGKKSLTWVLIALGVVFVAAILICIVMLLVKKPTVTPTPSPSPVASKRAVLNAEQTVTALKSLSHKGTTATIAKSDAVSGQTSENLVVYAAYPYQTTGRKFASNPEKAFGTGTVGTIEATTVDFAAFKKYFVDNTFSDAKIKRILASDMLVDDAVYVSTNVVCHVEQYDYTKSTDKTMTFKQTLASVSCSDLTSYKTIADTLEPIYKGLVANPQSNLTSSPNQVLALSNLLIKDGAEGYKNASVDLAYVGGSFSFGKGLLYQEPGKDWSFLKVTQDGLYCDDLTTTAQKKAFVGQTCIDQKSKKTVQVSTLL